jgi:alpha-glucuronidase
MDPLIQGWNALAPYVDQERFDQVRMLLAIQKKEAWWWHDACLAYFQSRSGLPYPQGVTPPKESLKFYESQHFHFVPGI